MNQERKNVSDRAFVAYDFGDGVEVEDANGWEYTSAGTEWVRAVFVRQPEEDDLGQPSTKLTFVVRFKPGTAEIEEAYAHDTKGNTWGVKSDGQVIGISIVVEARYSGDRSDLGALKASIESKLDSFVQKGLLSHGPFTPLSYETKVYGTSKEESGLDHEEIKDWIAGTIESGNMALEDIPKLMARYAMSDPSAMRSEFAERMGL